MQFQSVLETREIFKLAMIQGSYGYPVPATFYRVNEAVSGVLGNRELPNSVKHWYIYLLTAGLEQSNRWLLGKPIISQGHLEILRLALATVPLHVINSELMLNFTVSPDSVRLVLDTLLRFFDNPEFDCQIIKNSSGIMDARYFSGLPLSTRLKLHSVWQDPFNHLSNSVNFSKLAV